jgi:hypothetical protein
MRRMTETITSYCRMCPASCGVRVTVDNGAVVRLTSTDIDLDPLTGTPMLVGVPVTLRVVQSPA